MSTDQNLDRSSGNGFAIACLVIGILATLLSVFLIGSGGAGTGRTVDTGNKQKILNFEGPYSGATGDGFASPVPMPMRPDDRWTTDGRLSA